MAASPVRSIVLRTAALVAVIAASASAQTDPEGQARRLLEDARGYWAEGRHKQAFDNLQTVVSGFPGTAVVDDALLEIGRYHAEIDGDAEQARAAFEQLVQQFPQSDSAPGAYYQLGRLTLDRAVSRAELDDALAQFDRVQSLYPRSDWVPWALYGSGLVRRRIGDLEQSAAVQRRVSLEYPASEAAAPAQFEAGQTLALLRRPLEAMEAFQALRNRFPEQALAETALDRITALYRLHGAGSARFARDPAYSLPAGDALRDVRDIAIDRDGNVWLASDKVKAAIPFDARGSMGPSVRAEDLRAVLVTPNGDVAVVSRTAVRFGPRDVRTFQAPVRGENQPLDRILAAAATRTGTVLVSDERTKRVHRFSPDGSYAGSFPDQRERKVTRIALDGEGGIALLDPDARTITVYDEAGRTLRTYGPRGDGWELDEPSDVEIDPFLNVYVSDEKGGVLVLAPDGSLLASLGRGELRDPRALSLDPSGAVYVYDDKDRQIVRYR